MPISIVSLQHVNVRVVPEVEKRCQAFYGTVLGFAGNS